MMEFEPPLSVESAPPTFVTTPGVEAGPVMTVHLWLNTLLQYVQHLQLPVRHLLLLLKVPIVEKTIEIPQLQIVEKIVEIPELRTIQGTPTSESLGTAPVRHAAPAELVDMVELGPPSSAVSTPPVFVTAPMVEADCIVAEYVQPAQVGDIITDNLPNEEFAQALVPLDTAISQFLGHLKSMNERVSSSERTLEETRCKLDSRVLNRCTKHERRQLENDFASVSNMIQCQRDKIAEIKSGLSSALRQRQCLLDHRALQYPDHSKRRRLTE